MQSNYNFNMHLSEHWREIPVHICDYQNTEEKAQPNLHQSKHRIETPAKPSPIRTSDRTPRLTCTNKNIKKKRKPNQGYQPENSDRIPSLTGALSESDKNPAQPALTRNGDRNLSSTYTYIKTRNYYLTPAPFRT